MKKAQKPKSGPPIRCAHSDMAATDSLQPNPQNPNTHPPAQLSLYARILRHQGWRKAIVVSNQSGLIVTGHGAWLTARAEGWPRVPVDRQDFPTPADETAHLLADNGLPQMAGTDAAALKKLLRELDADLRGLTGFDAAELESLLADTSLKEVAIPPPPKMAWVLIGIPLVKFSAINAQIEQLAKTPGVLCETTVNDDEQSDARK